MLIELRFTLFLHNLKSCLFVIYAYALSKWDEAFKFALTSLSRLTDEPSLNAYFNER